MRVYIISKAEWEHDNHLPYYSIYKVYADKGWAKIDLKEFQGRGDTEYVMTEHDVLYA